MSLEQQWEPLILKKNTPKPAQPNRVVGSKVYNTLASEDPDPPKTLGQKAGQKIQQTRCNMKLTQKDLAQKINVTSNTIRDYEIGNIVPDHKTLSQICRILGLKISELK